MKKLFLLLILSFFSTTGFSASCPDLSEPTRTVSADGGYYIYTCDNSSNDDANNTSTSFSGYTPFTCEMPNNAHFREGGSIEYTISSRVSFSSDDAEESVSGDDSGEVSLDSSDLELGEDYRQYGPGKYEQLVGMRFHNINIPEGATIISAGIEFVAKYDESNFTEFSILGQRTSNSNKFNSDDDENISSRYMTYKSVNWSNRHVGTWNKGNKYTTPDLKDIVQEILNRDTWTDGNKTLTFFIKRSSGSGTRTAYSYNGSSSKAPKLMVTYESMATRDKDEDEDNSCYQSKEIDWIERESDCLPLGESFPNAEVTLFFDFDGYGTTNEYGTTYEKVASYYNLKKQDAIKKTIEQVAGNYAMWGINVTTDRTVFDDAGKRARILVVNRGDYSGRASTDGISTSSKPTGYVDSLSIFKPLERGKCAYVLTHEVGHNFRLLGTTNDYAVDYPDATIGAFMGGRTKDRFTGYQWKRILNKKGEWQDPPEYFQNAINK